MPEAVGLVATYDVTGYLSEAREQRAQTPWGEASYYLGRLGDWPVVLLQRYGPAVDMVQHLVNFRANVWGFRELGVRRVIAVDGVGSLHAALTPGTFVVVDDFLDFTHQGSITFFDGHGCSVRVDLSTPLCPEVGEALIDSARQVTDRVRDRGVLAAFQGPRFETKAEARMARTLGADVVGTLLVPEIVLAREAEICYGLLAIAINYAGEITPSIDRRGPGSMEDVYLHGPHRQLPEILREVLVRLPSTRRCPCARAVPQTVFGRLPAWYRGT
ncbi:MAG TPA: MTAP family purine nucleoside phosphorylase [bacterium]|nr:MTAP family purine nucleoside phosphorylase [bacterium]